MRISVDPDRCVGGGQCVITADDLFDQDDDGIVVLLDAEPGDDRFAEARTAARLCPSGAIEIEE
ncbi:ferredoxin [Enemella evansiae]|uniref:ferredoxin n=1 Tax=Enemella evansiae TaxID=2016499 RepID=UPI000B978C5C|nr:ferredoxin [Enemella evansiae]OYO01838.1 ferredoxin-1 [Enemella evansiae]